MHIPKYIQSIKTAVRKNSNHILQNKRELNGQIYAIRHAESTFNITFNRYLSGQSKYNPYYDINQVDANLSERGIQQCLESRDHITNLQVVYVSPMIRALQTAFLLFREYDNFNQIQFKIEPSLREGLWVSCDVPSGDIRRILDEFGNLFNKFDTQKIDKLIEDADSHP